jgi:hypothetical protein
MFPFEMEIHVHAPIYYNHISGAMVSVFTSSAGDREYKPDRVKPKTIQLVFVVSSLSTWH